MNRLYKIESTTIIKCKNGKSYKRTRYSELHYGETPVAFNKTGSFEEMKSYIPYNSQESHFWLFGFDDFDQKHFKISNILNISVTKTCLPIVLEFYSLAKLMDKLNAREAIQFIKDHFGDEKMLDFFGKM